MFLFLNCIVSVFREIRCQKKYVEKNIVPYLAELEKKCGGVFPSELRRKIIDYYCVLVPVILGVHFRKLYGQAFTERDRWSVTMTGLVTPIYDDLFDVYGYDISLLEKLTFDPDNTETNTFIGNISKEVSRLLLQTAPDPEAYRAICKSVFDVQVETLQQFDPNLSWEQMERITFAKGSGSFIFYHTHMMGMPDAEIAEIFYLTGGIHQTCNDLFDVYKDMKEGTYTLANTCKDFTAFRQFFVDKISIRNRKIAALPYPRRSKKKFALVMQSIEARGLVAIDQYSKLEKRTGKSIAWHELSRKDIVVDMEKPVNFLKWIYYTWKIAKMR